ncbi:MAG: TfoX/Sxy family protein [Pseudomonadota bacterium]
MPARAAERAWIADLFEPLGPVTFRAMMGGLCVYSEGQIFAILGPGDRLMLKATGPLAAALAAEGAEEWVYTRKDGKTARMPYWTLPDAALEDPEAASDWARRALAALA